MKKRKKPLTFSYDPDADALWVFLKPGVSLFEERPAEEVVPGILVRSDERGRVFAVEILAATKVLPWKQVASLHAEQMKRRRKLLRTKK